MIKTLSGVCLVSTYGTAAQPISPSATACGLKTLLKPLPYIFLYIKELTTPCVGVFLNGNQLRSKYFTAHNLS